MAFAVFAAPIEVNAMLVDYAAGSSGTDPYVLRAATNANVPTPENANPKPARIVGTNQRV